MTNNLRFSSEMEDSLQKNRVYLVKNMVSLDNIMDHLVQHGVFPDSEDILVSLLSPLLMVYGSFTN